MAIANARTLVGKISDKWTLYLKEYERIFSSYRSLPVALLEIGVQNGGSLDIWTEYFPKAALVMGLDINPRCGELFYNSHVVKNIVGDVNDSAVRSRILAEAKSFDIVIDDGSHNSPDIINTFCNFFP